MIVWCDLHIARNVLCTAISRAVVYKHASFSKILGTSPKIHACTSLVSFKFKSSCTVRYLLVLSTSYCFRALALQFCCIRFILLLLCWHFAFCFCLPIMLQILPAKLMHPYLRSQTLYVLAVQCARLSYCKHKIL